MNGAWLVVVAAGRGERLGRSEPKAFVPLAGHPLVSYCLESAAASDATSPPHCASTLQTRAWAYWM